MALSQHVNQGVEPKSQTDKTLDTILKGVEIAKGIFGIPVAIEQIKELSAKTNAENADADAKRLNPFPGYKALQSSSPIATPASPAMVPSSGPGLIPKPDTGGPTLLPASYSPKNNPSLGADLSLTPQPKPAVANPHIVTLNVRDKDGNIVQEQRVEPGWSRGEEKYNSAAKSISDQLLNGQNSNLARLNQIDSYYDTAVKLGNGSDEQSGKSLMLSVWKMQNPGASRVNDESIIGSQSFLDMMRSFGAKFSKDGSITVGPQERKNLLNVAHTVYGSVLNLAKDEAGKASDLAASQGISDPADLLIPDLKAKAEKLASNIGGKQAGQDKYSPPGGMDLTVNPLTVDPTKLKGQPDKLKQVLNHLKSLEDKTKPKNASVLGK